MKKVVLLFLFLGVVFVGELGRVSLVQAVEIDDLKNKIDDYQAKIEVLQKEKNTLSQQIQLFDSRIKVTTLQIAQTEKQIQALKKEITHLSGKIVRLDGSLDFLSKVLLFRVSETYKNSKTDRFLLLLFSKSLADFISRYRYLQAIQIHDRQMLLSMEQTRTSYDEQKQLKEKKQADLAALQKQLESQQKQLNAQMITRKRLLEETRGQEAVYQKLLAEAKAELEAILGILAGQGQEKEMKKVSEGEKIATVIQGSSCNSSGTHLHFMIVKDGQAANPFGYLKSVDFVNCSGSSCGSGEGDSFNPSGDWNWPMNPKIKLTQGYGYTWAIQHIPWLRGIYDFHNGIDINGASAEIKTVKEGMLFWGSFVGRCTLKYVRVHHTEGNYDTYYLHVNY